jgi:hypothetical protein
MDTCALITDLRQRDISTRYVFIYGFDYYAKWTLLCLVNNDVYVDGFLVDDEDEIAGHIFCNTTLQLFDKIKIA